MKAFLEKSHKNILLLFFLTVLMGNSTFSSMLEEVSFDVQSKHMLTLTFSAHRNTKLSVQPELNPFGRPPQNCASQVLKNVETGETLKGPSLAQGLLGSVQGLISFVKTDKVHPLSFLDPLTPQAGSFFVAVPLADNIVFDIFPSLSVCVMPDDNWTHEDHAGIFFSYLKSQEITIQFEYVSQIKLIGNFSLEQVTKK